MMLDFAVWAYEPDEEKLRSLLSSNDHSGDVDLNTSQGNKCVEKKCKDGENKHAGYQLLVHRTTSYVEPSESFKGTTNESDTKSKSKHPTANKKEQKRKPPGRVGYFVAVSHSQRSLLIGIKGTSTLEELLTDCCGRAIRVDLKHDPHYSPLISAAGEMIERSMNTMKCDESNNRKCTMMVERVCISHDAEDIEMEFAPDSVKESENRTLLKTKSNKHTSSTNGTPSSAPSPAENVILLPSQTSGVPIVEKSTNNQQTQQSSSFDEPLESHGIEMQAERSNKLRGVHEGIWHCAQQLFREIAPLVEEYAVSKGYDVICTGHSLGAGTATLLSVLIRGTYPSLVVPRSLAEQSQITDNERAAENIQRVRAYSFASPPVLDQASALQCGHYVVSIVNNSDIIPRSSLTNLDVLLTELEAVRSRLRDLGMNPVVGGKEACRKPWHIIQSLIALYRKLSEGTDGDLLLELAELQCVLDAAVAEASVGDEDIYWNEEGNHHLLVPGKLLMMYEPWKSTGEESDTANSYRAIFTDGRAVMLRGFEVGGGASNFSDHLTTSYYHALESLRQSLIGNESTSDEINRYRC
jgi:hypothetical protein